MKTANADKAWSILIDRNAERKENRPAFLAALILDKSRNGQSRSAIEAGEDSNLTPYMAEQFAGEFVRLAKRLHRHAENECNREITEAEEKRNDRDADRFEALANALGFEARTGGDPRGACAYLIDPDDRKGDGWGEGFAVYG